MSRLSELIQELCPNGVEYKTLKSVCIDFIVPMRDRPKIFDGDIPWCRIEDKEGQYFNKSLSGLGVSEEIIKKMNLKVFPVGTVICSCSASIGTYAINTQPLITNQTFIGLVCGENLYNKYLLYFMETQTKTLLQLATTGTIPYISRKKFEELVIPVPPLEVQHEIVRILDNFVEYTIELINKLTTEFIARKKQYEYYRNELLNFNNSIVYMTISEICNLSAGGDIPKGHWSKEKTKEYTIPIYSNGMGQNAIYGYTDIAKITKPCVTIAARGTIGYSEVHLEPFYPIVRLICAIPNSKILPSYLNYFIQTLNFDVPISGIPQLTIPMIEKYKIPVPSLKIQQRIVNVLDNFDTICADLNISLAAEIEARKKQYEYYRNILLTFVETGNIILAEQSRAEQSRAEQSRAEQSRAEQSRAEQSRAEQIKLLQYVFGYVLVSLGEIATITRGGNFQKKDFSETGIPCIHYGQIYTHYGIYADKTITNINLDVANKAKYAKKNDIIMAVTSENMEDVCKCVAWTGEEKIAVSGHTAIIEHNQNPKYLSYYFHTNQFFSQKKKLAHGTKVIEVTPDSLKNITIPLPSIEEQNRIVEILDRFDTLCNSLSNGLPAEIEARKKQYEYYRDKLLTFKELNI